MVATSFIIKEVMCFLSAFFGDVVLGSVDLCLWVGGAFGVIWCFFVEYFFFCFLCFVFVVVCFCLICVWIFLWWWFIVCLYFFCGCLVLVLAVYGFWIYLCFVAMGIMVGGCLFFGGGFVFFYLVFLLFMGFLLLCLGFRFTFDCGFILGCCCFPVCFWGFWVGCVVTIVLR